mmetsp:Transcript_62616/g.103243  ORF Transcript_62616/g.103243 Transcript_62616/m.103243 type:complete len:235 (+) Transcript_62616:389-1093(+)
MICRSSSRSFSSPSSSSPPVWYKELSRSLKLPQMAWNCRSNCRSTGLNFISIFLTALRTVRYTSFQMLLMSGLRGFILNNCVKTSRPSLNSANIMLQNTTSVARELGKYSFMMLLRSFLCSSNFCGSIRVTQQITGLSAAIAGSVLSRLALPSCPRRVSASLAHSTTISDIAMAIAECFAVLSWNVNEFLETLSPGTSSMSTFPSEWVHGVSILSTSSAGSSNSCFKHSCKLGG